MHDCKLHVREVQKEALSGRHENIPYLWAEGDSGRTLDMDAYYAPIMASLCQMVL